MILSSYAYVAEKKCSTGDKPKHVSVQMRRFRPHASAGATGPPIQSQLRQDQRVGHRTVRHSTV